MKIEFMKPIVPNYVRVKDKSFPYVDIVDLECNEFEEYIKLFVKTLRENKVRRMKE